MSGTPTSSEPGDMSPPGARITGTMLRDITLCERRPWADIHGDPATRATVSGFVEMLWSQGVQHEEEILAGLRGHVADLRGVAPGDRCAATIEAMRCGCDWILGARLVVDDLEGRPDLLHRQEGVWCAGDIKSGSALAPNGTDPRLEYAVQVGLYAHLLGLMNLGLDDRAFVIGSDGCVEWYDLTAPFGRKRATVAQIVASSIAHARSIRDGSAATRAALSAQCGLCVWRGACRAELEAVGDPTLVAGLGRSVRDALMPLAVDVDALANLDVGSIARGNGRTAVPGVGAGRLAVFRERARMLVSGAAPYATAPLGLLRREVEFHLDLETDPTARPDLCYLHGVLRRRRSPTGDVEDYVYFMAETLGGEAEAFASAVEFLESEPDALITTYSAFERTTYLRLAERYPGVVSRQRVEALFKPGRCIDLYFDVVLKATHWPLSSLGLKSVAKYLGFDWNDPDASGAASIGWFVEWRETRDPALLARILTYNRNDCIASRVVFDGLMSLPVLDALPWPPPGRARGSGW